MFTYFLYNLHPLFHLKVPEIPFLNSQLFSHTDDHLLQETMSELAECRLGAGVGGHVELHPSVREAVVAVHHMSGVLVSAKSLGRVLRR